MECHRCQHSAAVASGVWKRTPFENTPCGSCRLVESSAGTLQFEVWRADAAGSDGGGATEVASEIPAWASTEFVTQLVEMDPVVRDIVCWRLAGMSCVEVGAALGMSGNAVEKRLRVFAKRFPLFAGAVGPRVFRKGLKARRERASGGASGDSAVEHLLREKRAIKALMAAVVARNRARVQEIEVKLRGLAAERGLIPVGTETGGN